MSIPVFVSLPGLFTLSPERSFIPFSLPTAPLSFQREAESRARRAKRQNELLRAARLPMRMAMHEKEKLANEKARNRSQAQSKWVSSRHQPKKVPNFKRQHELFRSKLAEAKLVHPKTQPIDFSFNTEERKEQERKARERKAQRAAALEAKRQAERGKKEVRSFIALFSFVFVFCFFSSFISYSLFLLLPPSLSLHLSPFSLSHTHSPSLLFPL